MAARPSLSQVNLVVTDVEATVAFYRRLGLEPRDGPPEWRSHHVTFPMPGGLELEVDSTAFAKEWNRDAVVVARGAVVLGFDVESREEVDRLCGDLARAGYRVEPPPYDAFWGARYAVVEDPSGNPVGLMSPVDESRGRPKPPPP